jgi:hypothetical protein
MNVTAVILARTIRMIEQKRAIYLPDLVDAVRQRYGFVKFPQAPREIMAQDDTTTPLLFEHGKFEPEGRMILIQRLELFRQLVTADAATSTEDADVFLDDLLTAGAAIVSTGPRRLYMSQLEVSYAGNIPIPERMAPAYGVLARGLSRILPTYEPAIWPPEVPPGVFRITGTAMCPDPASIQLACDFRFERRANAPFRDNLHFSQAPLRTADHIALLLEFTAAADRGPEGETSESSSAPEPPSSL